MWKVTTIFGESYCETKRVLRKAMKIKTRGNLEKGIVILHNNARPHMASKNTGIASQLWIGGLAASTVHYGSGLLRLLSVRQSQSTFGLKIIFDG